MAKVHDPKTDEQIHRGRREKLRKRFTNYGLHTLNETEVVEYALGIAIPRIDTNPTAHRLIAMFGSLEGVVNAHPDKLKKVDGVGDQAACFLHFLKQFVTYYMAAEKKEKRIETPMAACEYLREVMKTYPTEHFVVLCLDKSGAVMLQQIIRGSLDRVDINLREIVEVIFRVHTASVVCAHNHMDGKVDPSDADMQMTRTLLNGLTPLGINLLDHIIFGNGREYSFARSGILDIFRREHHAFATSKDYEDTMLVTSQNNRPTDH